MTDEPLGKSSIQQFREALALAQAAIDEARSTAPEDKTVTEFANDFPYTTIGQMVNDRINSLVAKATALVTLLDDADRNHGGLYSGLTMKAANELRLELSKWKA